MTEVGPKVLQRKNWDLFLKYIYLFILQKNRCMLIKCQKLKKQCHKILSMVNFQNCHLWILFLLLRTYLRLSVVPIMVIMYRYCIFILSWQLKGECPKIFGFQSVPDYKFEYVTGRRPEPAPTPAASSRRTESIQPRRALERGRTLRTYYSEFIWALLQTAACIKEIEVKGIVPQDFRILFRKIVSKIINPWQI
jgi:hypothetical protein